MKQILFVSLIFFLGSCQENISEPITKIDFDEKLQSLKLVLPELSDPVANYVHATESNKIIYLAGKGPKQLDGTNITGKVGTELTWEEGYDAARVVGLNQLAVLKKHLGDLNKVKKILKVTGMVNADPAFTDHSKVINGFSDLMVEVFGEKGKHARAAVGMSSLPGNIAVEIEAIVETY